MARRVARRRRTAEERTRRRFVRRQWARRWLTWRYVLAFVVVVALVGGGIYAVYFSTALSVQGVDVVGEETIATKDVLAAADVPTGGPLATADLVAIERRVASIAVVRSVEVTRKWPHDVLITIQEREPVAIVKRGDLLRAVDVEGVLFGSYQRAPADLPRIETGADADVDLAADPDALREAVTVVAALPDEVADLLDHVELSGIDQVDLVLGDGRLVRWGNADASTEKAEIVVPLLQQDGQVFDVSVPGQPTVSDRP
ncbi:FtsQ-type POTRA domain-containing protein [Nocardioides dongxiaopingii]|nr:FtsQ-type POTRA domain-containing protein [Nocardioides sp. S-1144]